MPVDGAAVRESYRLMAWFVAGVMTGVLSTLGILQRRYW